MSHFNNNLDPDELSKNAQTALNALKSLTPEAPEFLVERVMAHHRKSATNNSNWRSHLLPRVSIAIIFLFLGILIGHFGQFGIQNYTEKQLAIGEPYALRLDLRPYQGKNVESIRIEIHGDSMLFTSRQHPQIEDKRALVFEWVQVGDLQFLPVVIKATKEGPASLYVQFFDSTGQVIDDSQVNFTFVKRRSG